MKKRVSAIVFFLSALFLMNFSALAASYSSAWYSSNGNWYIKGPNGNTLSNCWVCDNAAGPGSTDNWYLIDSNGIMVTAPLVVDATGHYYSLETNHNGNYGMLRHTNGTYDGVYLSFEQSHNGSFGAITNLDGINTLIARYGVYNVSHISPYNCYYTSSYGTASTSTTTYTTTRKLNYYVGNSKQKTTSTTGNSVTVISYGSTLEYWKDGSTGDIYYPGETFYFDGRTNVNFYGKFSSDYYTPSVQKTYTIYYYLDGEYYTTDTSTSSTMYVKEIGDGNLMKYTVGIGGDAIYPGQYYTFSNGQTSVSLYGILSTQDPYADNGYGW